MKTKLNYPSMEPRKPKAPRTGPETEAHLGEKWGWDYDQKFEKAKQLLEEFASPEFIDYLNHSGLGNYSGLIERFHDVAQKRDEALKESSTEGLKYKTMGNEISHQNNLQTRDDLNMAFSDAKNSYVKEYGNINTAPPEFDYFILKP